MSKPKKYLVGLSAEDAALLEVTAEKHGRKPTNFAEYLLRIQLGALQPVAPVKAQPMQATAPQTATAPQIPAKDEPQPATTAKQSRSAAQKETRKTDALKAAREQMDQGAARPDAARPDEGPAEQDPINRNVAAYTERIAAGIYSDGKFYTVNKFGRRTFHRTLEEAQKAAV